MDAPAHSDPPSPPITRTTSPPKPTASIRISVSAKPVTSTTSIKDISSPAKTNTMRGILTNESKSKPRHKSGASTSSGEKSSSRPKDEIDQLDGKTKACDRAKTFDTFVESGKLSAEPGKTEGVGHNEEVKRGLGKLLGRFGKGKGKERK